MRKVTSIAGAEAGGGGSGGGGGGGRSSMLCCGGDKDSGRDLKSAQNTPSRQPINQQQPFPQAANMMMDKGGMMGPGMGPPPLTQVGRMQQQQQMSNQMNNFDMRGGDDFKKVGLLATITS